MFGPLSLWVVKAAGHWTWVVGGRTLEVVGALATAVVLAREVRAMRKPIRLLLVLVFAFSCCCPPLWWHPPSPPDPTAASGGGACPRWLGGIRWSPHLQRARRAARLLRPACRGPVGAAGGLPGWPYVGSVRSVSGRKVPLRGGADLRIEVWAPTYDSNYVPVYQPRKRANVVRVAGYRTFRQVRFVDSFEGISTFGLGVRARLPFRVFQLSGPGDGSRLVIDVAHRWWKRQPKRASDTPTPSANRRQRCRAATAWPRSTATSLTIPTAPQPAAIPANSARRSRGADTPRPCSPECRAHPSPELPGIPGAPSAPSSQPDHNRATTWPQRGRSMLKAREGR